MYHSSYSFFPFSPDEHNESLMIGTSYIATSNDTPPLLRSSPERSRQLVIPHGICQTPNGAVLPANEAATAGKLSAIKNCKSPLEALIDDAQATRREDLTVQRLDGPAVRPRYLLPARYSCYQDPPCGDSERSALGYNPTQKSFTSDFAAYPDRFSQTASPEDATLGYESFVRAIPLEEQSSYEIHTGESAYATWASNDTCRPRSSVYSRPTVVPPTASDMLTTIRGLRQHPPPQPSSLPTVALGKPGSAFTPNEQKPNRQNKVKSGQDSRRPSRVYSQFIPSLSPLKVRHHHDDEPPQVMQQQPRGLLFNKDVENGEKIIGNPQKHSIITDRKHLSRGWWDIIGHPFSIDGKVLQGGETTTRITQMDDRTAIDQTSTAPVIAKPVGSGYNSPTGGSGGNDASDHPSRGVLEPPRTRKPEYDTAQLVNSASRASSSRHLGDFKSARLPLHARRGRHISRIHTSRDDKHRCRCNGRQSQMRRHREYRSSRNITFQTINFITGEGIAKANQHQTIQSFSPIVNPVYVPPPLKLSSQRDTKPKKKRSGLQYQNDFKVPIPTPPVSADLQIHCRRPDVIPATQNPRQLSSVPTVVHGNSQGQGSEPFRRNATFPAHTPAAMQEQREAQYKPTTAFPSTLNDNRAIGGNVTASHLDNGKLTAYNNYLPPYSPTDPRFDPIAAAAYVAATTARHGGETNTDSSLVIPEANVRREDSVNGFITPPESLGSQSRPDSLDIFAGAAVLKEPQPGRKDTGRGNVNQWKRGRPSSELCQMAGTKGCNIPHAAAVSRQQMDDIQGMRPPNELVGHRYGIEGSNTESNNLLRDTRHLFGNFTSSDHFHKSNISGNHSANSQFTSHTRFSDRKLFRSIRAASHRNDSSDTIVPKLPTMNHATCVPDNSTAMTGTKKGNSRNCRTCFCTPASSSSKPKRRCFWLFIISIILLIIAASIVTPVLYRTLGHRKSRWVHPDDYPALPTGISTIAGTKLSHSRNDCITPSTIWSCSIPKEARLDEEGQGGDQPNFVISIKYQNPNDTVTSDTQAVELDNFVSWPEVPALKDMAFMGNTTDGVEGPSYAGESTPFWVTFISPSSTLSSSSSSSSLASNQKRAARCGNKNSTSSGNDGNHDDHGEPLIQANMTSPNPDIFIPRPRTSSNGTALPAQLYPLAENQPLRLYNRGSENEHYGFYTYFERRIFLAGLTSSDNDTAVADEDGGSSIREAKAGCFWGSTRFFVQIWTSSLESSRRHLIGPTHAPSEDMEGSEAFSLSSASAAHSSQPGSFPYPVTISIDRHGGVAHDKMVYCYALDEARRYIFNQNRIVDEDRGKGGRLIDAAPDLYLSKSNKRNIAEEKANEAGQANGDSIDGGTGGCVCQYRNWV
ncbi:hypothetical protein KEM54_000256 [Ascosphaera aggregata]|nr:hypothetical protein KEM54_000256 [Ascosphaera aggregata]